MRRRWLALAACLALALPGCLSGSTTSSSTQGPAGQTRPPESPSFAPDAALAQTGRWEAPFEGEVPAVNMVLLHDGRVLYWSGVEADEGDGPTELDFFTAAPLNASSRVLDLSGEAPAVLSPLNPDGAGSDLFCAGQTVLPDGRVLAVGASVWSTDPAQELFLHGGTDARLFDPATNTWERKADMLFGRWYPTAITLPDGKAFVASGIGSLSNPTQQWPQMETYDPAKDTWTYLAGDDRLLPLYARLTVVPGGPLREHLFYNTVGTLWGPFGEHPEQPVWSFQQDLDFGSSTWTYDGLSSFGARQHAASVMTVLDPAKGYAPTFITFGGTLYQSLVATPFTEVNDLSTNPPTNTVGPAMASPRWHLNGVLLPDDSVLAVGGGLYDNVIVHGQPNVPVLSTEQYDVFANTWTTLASMTVPRMYHSTALLLPDGRVLAGGHVPLPNPSPTLRQVYNAQVKETRFEVFDPPYLFRGPRPTIVSAPTNATYGETFTVRVDDASKVMDVLLMRPGATTHAYDADQRGVRLAYTVRPDGTLAVQAPPDPTVIPPGYDMLFVMGTGDGGPVPSVASFLHLA